MIFRFPFVSFDDCIFVLFFLHLCLLQENEGRRASRSNESRKTGNNVEKNTSVLNFSEIHWKARYNANEVQMSVPKIFSCCAEHSHSHELRRLMDIFFSHLT